MKQIVCIFALSLFFVAGCTTGGKKEDVTVSADKSRDFKSLAELTVDSVEAPLVGAVERIFPSDSVLTVKAGGSSCLLYRLSLPGIAVTDSLCRKGEGPDEILFGEVAPLRSGGFMVFDNAKMKWKTESSPRGSESGAIKAMEAVNDVREIDFPVMGFVDLKPSGLSLRIRDFRTGEDVDSLTVPNVETDGISTNDSFAWDYSPKNRAAVIAYNNSDRLTVARLSPEGFGEITEFRGDSSSGQIYYTDVKASDNAIYLLSQRNVDIDDISGYSEIEVYDYQGNPLMLSRLPVIAVSMAIDDKNGKIYLVSGTTDRLYTAVLPQ